MREKMLIKLAGWHTSHPWRMLLIVGLLTTFFFVFAGRLEVTTRTSDLLPSKDEKVVQFNKIIDEFATATSLVVVVQGEEQRIKEFADELAPKILGSRDSSQNDNLQKKIAEINEKINKLKQKTNKNPKVAELQSEIKTLQARMDKKLFQRVDYKAEVDFLKNHMLMLVKEDDLKNMKDVFTDPNLAGLLFNINTSMEKEYVGQEESISTREKEDGAWAFLEGIENLIILLQKIVLGENVTTEETRAAADKLLLGEPYFLSYDKQALIMNAVPNFTLMERDLIMVSTATVQAIVDNMLKDFPDVKAGLSGAIPKEHDEQVYAQESLGYTTLIALIAILLLLIISFRMWVAPVFAIFNLLVGVIWALGTAAIVVGRLNLFTSTMSVIILGLGIDFSIHLISGFTERRAAGENIPEALKETFLKSGKGVLTGAVTTACAFLALIISSSRGMKEMGLVMGTGLLAILLATMLCLPVMLVLRESRIERKRKKKITKQKFVQRDISFRFLGRLGEQLSRHYVFTILASLAISAFLIWSASKIKWDYDYRNMEPKGLTSMTLIDTVMEKFDLSMDYALLIADSIDESYELSKKYRELNSVAMTEDISLYLPSQEQQQKRVPHVLEIKNKIQAVPLNSNMSTDELKTLSQEIERLEMNIMEMQDMAYLGGRDKVDDKCKEIVGDPEQKNSKNIIRELQQLLETDMFTAVNGLSWFQQAFGPYYKESILKMASIDPISLEDLPETIQDRYSNRNRNQFLVTLYPSGSIYEGEFLNRFVDDIERVSKKATGTPPLVVALLKIFGRDGRNAILLTLAVVFFILWVDFRRPGYALMAMVPLAFGFFWMIGFMYLGGAKLSMMSVMGFPLIIGIGIDDGVHIMHRWRNEGPGKIRIIFANTGKAIFLTSLTTMLAFGSLTFSAFPAWGQFGGALFLGVAACFLTTVIILPGIIGKIERKKKN
ncbi:RND family transporter [Acidobacteriota bacterium]